MPVEIIMDDPRMIALPAAGRGMLFNLIWHFWITECRSLPKSNAELFAIAGAHPSTWVKFKSEIIAIISDAAPALIKWREDRKKARLALATIRERGSGALTLAKLNRQASREREARAIVAPGAELGTPITPRLSEKERATRISAPPVKAKISKGFVDRKG